MSNVTDQFNERMRKIGSKGKRNFSLESQNIEMKENHQLVIMNKRTDGGITTIDLILEPDKFDSLSSKCRLDFEEFIDVMNDIADEEEDDWDTLRMKDQVNIVRDRIIEATILKYAKEEYELDMKEFSGKDLNYIKRFDEQNRFLGEATILTLTKIR